ncbi:MAG: ribonuclease Z [Jeotgalicoccus sp.]
MKFTVLGSGAGLPSKDRNTQSFVIDCVLEYNEYILIDAGEALQHRILHTHIKPSKIKNIFITHLHGDHIFGLPGFLSSRAFQGGENIPLKIYGPKGLAEWIQTTFRISESTLNYPLEIIEVAPHMNIRLNDFDVHILPLSHGIESYAYIFKEDDKIGELQTDKLRELGLKPGPVYGKIKSSDTFTVDDTVYNTSDFIGETIKGRKITVHGDTRLNSDDEYLKLLNDSDLIVHEATFLKEEKEKAHDYFHSEINQVLDVFNNINYKTLMFVHISNRYTDEDIKEVNAGLNNRAVIAYDYFELPIPRNVQ